MDNVKKLAKIEIKLRETSLDMRHMPVTQGEQEHNCNKLDKLADDLHEILVSGHGTGQPDTQK